MPSLHGWSLIITCLLVGTQMNEDNNLKQNLNPKPEKQNTDQNIGMSKQEERNSEEYKNKQRYIMALHCLKQMKKADKNVNRKNWNIKRKRHQAVVNKYLKEHPEEKELYKQPHSRRPFKEVITDPLYLSIVGKTRENNECIRSGWPSIEADLIEIITNYKASNVNSPIPSYDTSEIHRGFRIIKCIDDFSKEFITGCFQKICDKWKNLNLKLIPAEELPKKLKDIPSNTTKKIELRNANRNYVAKKFIKSNNKPKLNKLPAPPPAPSWPSELKCNKKSEIVSEEKRIASEYFRENIQNKQFVKEAPQTQNKMTYMNSPRNIDFQLSTNYDTRVSTSNLCTQPHEMGDNFFSKSNFQRDYPETPWQNSYNNNYFHSAERETQINERLERNQNYSEVWQKFSDYSNSLGPNFQAAYQNSQQNFNQTYTNSTFFFNNRPNFNNCTSLSSAQLKHNEFSQAPSNFTTNYGHATFSTVNSNQNFKAFTTTIQQYSSRPQLQNFSQYDDDEVPPPPPSLKNFFDSKEDMERSRRRGGGKSYWN